MVFFKVAFLNACYMLFVVRDLCLDMNNLYVCKLIVVSTVSWFQRAQAALQAVNAMQSGSLAVTSALAAEGGPLPGQGSVLRIIVENLFYPVTLEVLYQVMRIAKKIVKICSNVAIVNPLIFFFF